MKRNYIQPSVTVAQVALNSMILAASVSRPSANNTPLYGIPTDDQW